jgi:hypothetical protein
MKKVIILLIFSVTVLLLTGCYTQVATSNSEEDYTEGPIVIIIPIPQPIGLLTEPIPPSNDSPPQKEKIRNPEQPTSVKEHARDKLRNSGGRNNTGKRNKR